MLKEFFLKVYILLNYNFFKKVLLLQRIMSPLAFIAYFLTYYKNFYIYS